MNAPKGRTSIEQTKTRVMLLKSNECRAHLVDWNLNGKKNKLSSILAKYILAHYLQLKLLSGKNARAWDSMDFT